MSGVESLSEAALVGEYSKAEIEFLQCLLDRYSEDGAIIDLGNDHAAFMKIVRKNLPALLAELAGGAK